MIVKRFKIIRRVTVTCPAAESSQAIDWIYKNGYTLMSSGYMREIGSRLRRDPSKFKIVGEKKIKP